MTLPPAEHPVSIDTSYQSTHPLNTISHPLATNTPFNHFQYRLTSFINFNWHTRPVADLTVPSISPAVVVCCVWASGLQGDTVG